ncbi:MAG: hypothetical protein DSY80_04850 [Desulfocapsa sp.]|nr:MAG: hypothetical protein DSY80_04850 [Desulfocapsa sp.]
MNDLNATLYAQMNKRDDIPAVVNKEEENACTSIYALDSAANHAVGNIALLAVNAIRIWLETDNEDLDDNEGFGDRLLGMFVGIADSDKNGEINDEEHEIISIARGAAGEYLKKQGVGFDEISKLLGKWDNDCAKKVHDELLDSMPDENEGTLDDIDNFVFNGDFDIDEDDLVTLDNALKEGVVLDATYKKKVTFTDGKKTFKNMRISGKVKLSPKMKLAIKKMQRKSHNPKATLKRMKSMRARKKAGY